MSCVTPSIAAPAASIVAPASSTLAVGSTFAANPACNPSLSTPPSTLLHSPPAPPLASAHSISQLYSTKISLPPGATIATPSLLRPPPLQLFVANIAEGSEDKAAVADLGSRHIDQDIDIDIDMDGDLGAGSTQDSDVGSDDHAHPSVSHVTAGVSMASGSPAKQDRRPASSSRVLTGSASATAVTASGSRQQPLHSHSLSESQISPIRSLTALALSQSRSPSQSPRLGHSSAAASRPLRPLLDASAQQELLLKVEDIQRYCDSLRQVQVQQASKIRSLEATVRRFSDVTSPSSTHQHTPAATTTTSSAAAQLVSAAVSPPPPSSSIDERMSSHYHQHHHQHHQRMMMPPAFAPLTASSSSAAAAAGGSRPIPHLPSIQAPMASLSSTSIHRTSDVTPADIMSESPQYSHQPQPAVAYHQSHSAAAAVASERRIVAQMSAGMEQQQHGSQPPPQQHLPLTAPQHSQHHAYSQQTSTHASPTSFAPRFPAPTHGHQQSQAYRQPRSDQFSPKMARQASPLPQAALGGSQAHSHHHHHRSLGASSRSQLHQHSYQRPSGSVNRSRRGSAAPSMPLESDRGAMPAPYAMSSGHGDERDMQLPHHHQHLQAVQHPQPQRQFQALPPPPLPLSSSSSSRRASAGPSAFGYPAIAASTATAMPAPLGSATPADFGPRSAGGADGGQAGALPVIASGHPSMRMKRPRDAESGDEFAGADVHVSGASGDAAGDVTLSHTSSRAFSMQHQHLQQQPPPHLHHHPAQSRHSHHSSHHHAVLPPIRIGGGGDGPQQVTPTVPARAAATSFGGNTGSSLHLVQPSAIAYTHSGHVASDYSGTVDGPVFSGGSSSEQPARGNRDAQPTHAWLASQRQYKTALLHLLSLESFYPSDMAMLNMFRSMGDFTADQVEIHGATLLSWARGWLRYSRNAVLRSTLENKAKEPVKLLAEALQHDLHSETDFTTPPNLRRCALLRLIYFQWQAINKLGTKSQSMYRDYESRLREIDALPTLEEQEREWETIVKEEQQRRLEIIRDSRQRSDSVIQPRTRVRPEQMFQSRIQMTVAPPQAPPSMPPQMSTSAPVSASATAGQSELAHGTSAMQQLSLSRRQSADWLQAYPPSAQSPTPGPSHYHYSMQHQQQQQQQPQQHYQGAPLPSPSHLHYRHHHYHPAQPLPPPPAQYPRNLSYSNFPQQQQPHQQRQLHYRSREPDGDMQVESMDNDSEMSVNMSPEPQ
ncbi:hypothetical protein GGI19_002045 [Coemansia pectinata]|uniref:Uncharacterized protein n=1 Tax=Coemansia pectinata TaxID=1052879 RepID=A0A9W8GXV9_9FUNG|nr:hypothetical protein GGI19_002045 [Coemansia pectinata]